MLLYDQDGKVKCRAGGRGKFAFRSRKSWTPVFRQLLSGHQAAEVKREVMDMTGDGMPRHELPGRARPVHSQPELFSENLRHKRGKRERVADRENAFVAHFPSIEKHGMKAIGNVLGASHLPKSPNAANVTELTKNASLHLLEDNDEQLGHNLDDKMLADDSQSGVQSTRTLASSPSPLLPKIRMDSPSSRNTVEMPMRNSVNSQSAPLFSFNKTKKPKDDYHDERAETGSLHPHHPAVEQIKVTPTVSSRLSSPFNRKRMFMATERSRSRNPSPTSQRTGKDYMTPLQRFRKAVKMIITLMRATSNSRGGNQQHTVNNNLLSFYQYQQEILDSEGAACQSDLTFDPHQFRARRETTLSSDVKAILCMEPGRRSVEQRHLALAGLQLAVAAFSEFPIRMQESLVRVGWYENFGAKRMIIRQGHFADNFYLILSGTAVVTILETDKETGEPRVRTAAFLGRGNSFGELALMHGAKRSATVTCKDNVELLAVGREDFIAIFMSVPKDREPDHIRFLRKLDILQGWPFEKIPWSDPKICLLTYFRRGVVMCRDINKSEWIYVIKTGSCRALACLQATSPSVKGLLYQKYAASMATSKHKTLLLSASTRGMLSSRSQTSTDLLNTLSSNRHDRSNKLIIYTKPLPPIEPVRDFHERHKAILEKIYKEKHVPKQEDTTGNPPESEAKKQSSHRVFLQLQLLSRKDTFGLQPVSLLDDSARISLVSDGAEAVLINRRFFVHHLSYDMRKHLASTIQPYPTQQSLQQKFEDQKNWDDFKVLTVSDHVNYTRYIHDTLEV